MRSAFVPVSATVSVGNVGVITRLINVCPFIECAWCEAEASLAAACGVIITLKADREDDLRMTARKYW